MENFTESDKKMSYGEKMGIIFVLIFIFVSGFSLGHNSATFDDFDGEYWFNEYDECVAELDDKSATLSDYQNAFYEANSIIEDANDMIYDARWNAWEDYETMGETLENLEDIDTVYEP